MKQKSQRPSLKAYYHSTSHILAYAVKELYPHVRLGIGPATEDGFYYDFDLFHRFTPDELGGIEKKMQEIINKDYPFIKRAVLKEEAVKFFQMKGEIYKVELLKEIEEEEISLYEVGNFVDLCKGPHIVSTGG